MFCKLEHIKLGNLGFLTIEVCCHPLIMISSVMYPRFIHIALEILQSITAFLLAQTRRFSIRFLGVSVWEEIPLSIRMSSNVYIFKRKLCTHLVGEIVK